MARVGTCAQDLDGVWTKQEWGTGWWWCNGNQGCMKSNMEKYYFISQLKYTTIFKKAKRGALHGGPCCF